MALRTGNSSKEPAGPDGLEPEIKGAPRPSELWLSEVLWLTELVIHSSRSAERALKEDPVNARLLATFLLGIEVAGAELYTVATFYYQISWTDSRAKWVKCG